MAYNGKSRDPEHVFFLFAGIRILPVKYGYCVLFRSDPGEDVRPGSEVRKDRFDRRKLLMKALR